MAGPSNAQLIFFQGLPLDADVIEAHLKRFELRYERFSDPKLYLLSLRTQRPKLCLIDCTTPGVEVAFALSRTISNVFGREFPVLAIVPRGDKAFAEKAIQAGAAATVEEPLLEADFARKILEFLHTKALEKAAGKARLDLGELGGETPPLVRWLYESIIPILIQASEVLHTFDDVDRQLKFYAERLKPYEEQLIGMVKILRRKPEKIDLLQSLRVFGVANARNLVATITLANLIEPRSFAFDPKSGLPNREPKKLIPMAIRAVEHLGEGSRYQASAFAAGLVLDLFARLAQDKGERKRALLKLIEQAYLDSIRRVDKGLKLGKKLEDLALERHLFTVLMMREAGRVAMAFQFEDYVEVRKYFEKNATPLAFQLIAEEQKYGLAHNLAGAMLCQGLEPLQAAAPAVLLCDMPLPELAADADSRALAAFSRTL